MNFTLLQGASIETAVKELGRMASEGSRDENVRQLAAKAIIIGEGDPRTAIADFVRNTFGYAEDPDGMELFIHPRRVAEDYNNGEARSFDCDDHAMLCAAMAAMFKAADIRTRIVVMDSDGDGEYDHAICEVYSNVFKDWETVDTSGNIPVGWVIPTRKAVATEIW